MKNQLPAVEKVDDHAAATVDGGVSASRVVAADPMTLYHWIADVTRTPDWQTRVRRSRWLGDVTTVGVGATFLTEAGSRVLPRRQRCEVFVAKPGRELGFRTTSKYGRSDRTTWRFRFDPVPGGTRLTYTYSTVRRERQATRDQDLRRALERIAALVEGRVTVQQPQLGQAHTAEGPLDLSAMFVMHHGFRRDLRDLTLAVPATPLTDAEVWAALDRRWRGMATALHHHHRVEDDALWPPLLHGVNAVNDSAGQESLKAMQAEHALLDPLVQACTEGFLAMVSAPDAAVRDRLVADLARTRELLLGHLAHEETDALPLAQRHLSSDSWEKFGTAARKEYGLADIAFATPWSTLEIPGDQFDIAYAHGGALVRAILAVTGRRFEREHRTAFRYLPAAGSV